MTQTMLVTGATGYFGRYFVDHLSKEFQVIALGRNRAKLDERFGENIVKVVCNFEKPGDVQALIPELLNAYDIGGLVNNAYPLGPKAGFNTDQGRLENHSVDIFNYAFTCGLWAPFVLSQAVGNHWIKQGKHGAIVNISSMYGSVAPDPTLYEGKETFNPISYGMVKSALEYMTRYMASFWGSQGVRCNAIAPGPFPNTEFLSDNSTVDREFIGRLDRKTCNGAVGHPKDLLGILSLLLGEQGAFINGQVIHVDGGWTVR